MTVYPGSGGGGAVSHVDKVMPQLVFLAAQMDKKTFGLGSIGLVFFGNKNPEEKFHNQYNEDPVKGIGA